jgi:hypothetical protein
LSRRGDADRLVVEGEALRVLNEVEQVRVAPAELLGAVDAEGVVPDNPVPQGQAHVAVEDHLQLGRELVADRQPERAVRLERPDDLAGPPAGPVEVVVGVAAVIVDVVVVADVERRVGED